MFQVWNEPCRVQVGERLRIAAEQLHQLARLPETRADWELQRTRHIAGIREKMRLTYDATLELDVKIHREIQMKGYRVQHLTYQSRPGLYVTATLYVPDGKGPFPAVINMHGHWSEGRLAERIQARGHALAAHGYVCLSPDVFGSGERATTHGVFEYHGAHLGASLFDVDETLMGMQLTDNMRGVDVLCACDKVDATRIGATGASGGGAQTMWLTALDARIAAAVPVVSIGTFESHVSYCNCVCEVLPDGLTVTEQAGVLALAAPRPLYVLTAMHDAPTFHPQEMLRSVDAARNVYGMYKKTACLQQRVFNAGHGYFPEMREAMLGWFDKHLKGVGDGQSVSEKSFRTLSEKEMMCFPDGDRPAQVAGIAAFCREKGAALHKKLFAKRVLSAEKKREVLLDLLRAHAPVSIEKTALHFTKKMWGRTWEAHSVLSADGMLLPVWVTHPKGKSKTYQLVAPPATAAGKLDVMNDAVFIQQAKENSGMVVFDLWGTGETEFNITGARLASHHDFARAHLWTGKTLMGEWVRNVMLMKQLARSFSPRCDVSVLGWREGALAALFAAATDTEMNAATLVQLPISMRFAEKPSCLSMGVHVPGFLGWGDVSLAMALCKHMPTSISLEYLDGRLCTPEDEAVWREEIAALSQRIH